MTDPVGGYIREQPEVVPVTYRAGRAALKGRSFPDAANLTIVGSGSSLNAATAMAPTIAQATGGLVHLLGPTAFQTELAAGRLRSRLVVILSQSGESRTTIQAAIKARELGCEVVRITGEPGSPFALLDGETVLMPIGPEPIGPKTKGFGASLAALAALADALGNRPASPPALDSAFVERARREAIGLAQALPELDYVLVAGAGAHLGTALEASLKISEMSGIPSAGFDMEEALHGRLHGLTERSLAIFIAGTVAEVEDAERAAATMRELGPSTRVLGPELAGALFRDGPGGAGAGALDPIQAIVPFQWLAWALAGSRGLDPADMRYPGLSARLAIKTNSLDR